MDLSSTSLARQKSLRCSYGDSTDCTLGCRGRSAVQSKTKNHIYCIYALLISAMTKLAYLVLLPLATAFNPSSLSKTGSVVQNVIASKWTMMPDEPAPEVSGNRNSLHTSFGVPRERPTMFLGTQLTPVIYFFKRLILVERILMNSRNEILFECLSSTPTTGRWT